jgi:hypothetical protein
MRRPHQSRFDLQPGVAPAAREILACAVLGQSLLFDVVTECRTWDRGKDLPKNLLAPDQGQAAKIVAVQIEDVKDLIEQMAAGAVAAVVLPKSMARRVTLLYASRLCGHVIYDQ